jgi:cell division protein FtsL
MVAQDVWRRVRGGRAQAPVRDRRRRARGRVHIGRTAVLAAVVLACGLVHVWVRLQVTTLGYDLSAAREIVARLEQEQRELETELAMLTAPQRLEEEAGRRLRMHEPKPGQVVVLR